MEKNDIVNLSEKNFSVDDLNEIKKNYEISHGKYNKEELIKAIENKSPFFMGDYFIIGYEDDKFISDKNDKISIDRMVKSIIVEDIKDEPIETPETRDYFTIIGKDTWDDISEFRAIFDQLRVGEIFLPPHSAVFNFVKPTEEDVKKKIVSVLQGVNIDIFSRDNYVDNAIHEVGHLFWRESVTCDEKMKFKKHFEHLKPSAIYQYKWEHNDEEEMFCTIYKWYIKSILINKSFYNILEYEDKVGCDLLKAVFDRIAKDKMIADIFELNKDMLFNCLNPKYDITSQAKILKKADFDQVKDIELPDGLLNDIHSYQDGVTYINLNKARVPVEGNRIIWEKITK